MEMVNKRRKIDRLKENLKKLKTRFVEIGEEVIISKAIKNTKLS